MRRNACPVLIRSSTGNSSDAQRSMLHSELTGPIRNVGSNEDAQLSKDKQMVAPEYRVGFRVLREKIGLQTAFRLAIPSFFKALIVKHKAEEGSDKTEQTKANLKNHFQFLANMYQILEKRYGKARTDEVMKDVVLEGGKVYFQGFAPLGPGGKLRNFAEIYKAFECNNIVFDVIEETDKRFEIEIKRCLVFEAFTELGVPVLTQWICDIAFHYFSRYHPHITYEKDRMIARGAATCHEVFTWV